MAEFEKLAYEAALRGLDKQEGQLEEMRGRTGVLLAASSLAASFLGQQAFLHPHPRALAVAALLAFVVSMGSGVFILMPKEGLEFSGKGAEIYAYEVVAAALVIEVVSLAALWGGNIF